MNEDRVTISRTEPITRVAAPIGETVVEESVRRSPSGAEVARRAVVFVFGLIQLVILLRIVLLLLDADRANDLVQSIYGLSAVFIAPFEGMLRTDAIGTAGSVLDIAAIVALVGWTILELVAIAAIGILRREP